MNVFLLIQEVPKQDALQKDPDRLKHRVMNNGMKFSKFKCQRFCIQYGAMPGISIDWESSG